MKNRWQKDGYRKFRTRESTQYFGQIFGSCDAVYPSWAWAVYYSGGSVSGVRASLAGARKEANAKIAEITSLPNPTSEK